MTEFKNNLRTGDQVFHVDRKQRGIVDRDPSPKSRETRVASTAWSTPSAPT